MARFILALMLTGLLASCATATRDPWLAAGADTVTTQVALAHGAVELNPLGAAGAAAAKLVYLLVLRQDLAFDQRREADRLASSLWWGASVNNLLQISVPGVGLGSLAIGAIVAWGLYSAPQQAICRASDYHG